MDKIEKDIFDAILKCERYDDDGEAIAAAGVAKKFLSKFVDDFELNDMEDSKIRLFYEKWITENL